MKVNDAIMAFGFDCKVRKLSAKTVGNYQKQLRYIEKYLKDEFEITEIEQIKPYHIKQFLAMMDDRNRKPRYINDLLKVAKTFLNYCKREGHVNSSAAANVKNMKQDKREDPDYSRYWARLNEIFKENEARTGYRCWDKSLNQIWNEMGMIIYSCPRSAYQHHRQPRPGSVRPGRAGCSGRYGKKRYEFALKGGLGYRRDFDQ